MLQNIPNEILLEVFSHLTLSELCQLRSVCKLWNECSHLSVAFNVQKNDSKLHICTLTKLNKDHMMDLSFSSYISSLDMIEFKPLASKCNHQKEEKEYSANIDRCYQFNSNIHGLRMVFGPWQLNKDLPPSFSNLDPVQRAQYLFHGQYKPIHQRLYLLPHDSDINKDQFWIGDASLGILILLERIFTADQQHHYRVKLARVSISWIVSGYDGPAPRYYKSTELKQSLENNNHNDADDADCRYVIRDTKIGTLLKDDEHCFSLADSSIELHQDSALSRWRQLHSALLICRCDPLVIWKYNFVKEFVLGKTTNDTLEIILSKLRNGELVWNSAKPGILKLINQSSYRSNINNNNNTLQSRLASLFISKKK